MTAFRDLMGMSRIDLVPGYKEVHRKYTKKTPSAEEHKVFRKAYQQFGQNVYIGNYNAVYLDEIKRSDGSAEAQQFGELLKRVRYGKFENSDINELKNLSATIKDVESDSDWKYKTVLTDYHFYSERSKQILQMRKHL